MWAIWLDENVRVTSGHYQDWFSACSLPAAHWPLGTVLFRSEMRNQFSVQFFTDFIHFDWFGADVVVYLFVVCVSQATRAPFRPRWSWRRRFVCMAATESLASSSMVPLFLLLYLLPHLFIILLFLPLLFLTPLLFFLT